MKSREELNILRIEAEEDKIIHQHCSCTAGYAPHSPRQEQ